MNSNRIEGSTPSRAVWTELGPDLKTPQKTSKAVFSATEFEEPKANIRLHKKPGALGRRGFLRAAGLSAMALAGCSRREVDHALPYLKAPEELTPGVTSHYASTCTACPASCGLMVSVRDGHPIKLEGLPEHARTRSGLCALGQADLRALYDGQRLKAPAISGKQVSWADLDKHVLDALAKLPAGSPFIVMSRSWPSPSAQSLVRKFAEKYNAIYVQYDAMSESAALDVRELFDGRAMMPSYKPGAADILFGFGSDFLATGKDPVYMARSYTERRGFGAKGGTRIRHIQIEGSLSLTGVAADERIPASAAGERLIALKLLYFVAKSIDSEAARSFTDALKNLPKASISDERIAGWAAELKHHGDKSLVLCGSDDRLEQAAVLWINRLLGSENTTVLTGNPTRMAAGRDAALNNAIELLISGKAKGFIAIDCDPVDDLPAGEALGKAIAALPLSIALSERKTATAKACAVVAAAHHGLERWGDFAPEGDSLTVAQPTVRPLFTTRHPVECLMRWMGDPSFEMKDAYEYLRRAWKDNVISTAAGNAGFEQAWSASVARGSLVGATPFASVFDPPPKAPGNAAEVFADLLKKTGALEDTPNVLEAELIEEVSLRDGKRAHVPWLRELPDPLTRASWEACIRIAPSKARELGVKDGDVVELTVGKASIEMSVRVLPGQHPQVLGVPVGYGRADGEEQKNNRNAYRIASWTESGQLKRKGLKAGIKILGRKVSLPLIQNEMSTHGRPIVHQVGSINDAIAHEGHGEHLSMWAERPPFAERWELVIDLDRCTGCSACIIACQAENNLPVVGPDEMQRHRDMHWLRMDRYFMGEADNPDVLFEPMMCAQCGNAPCETVCPVAATVHSHDGLNMQAYNRCVGTRYCANNCPYKARRFNWFDHPIEEPIERMVLNPDVVMRERGVMEKCTFCAQRIQAARIEGKGGDKAMTACQQSCPSQAILFGNGADPNSPIAALKQEPRAFQVLAELGVRPSITYLSRIRPGGRSGEMHANKEKGT